MLERSTTDTSTIYSTYNARMLSAEEIARTFVINDHYRRLLRNEHSVLRGPRGTGKTTLLKMLTAAGLNAWKDREKIGIPLRLPFLAVYIPSDVIWSEQIQQLTKVPEVGEQLSKAAVACNVLHALLGSFRDVINVYFREELSPEISQNLCLRLSSALRVQTFPTIEGLRTGLAERLRDINNVASRIRDYGDKPVLPDHCYDDYFSQVRLLCSIFEEIVRGGKEEKWALCFDELEIAPDWLVEDLIKKLRSTDQRFLLKISISPTYRIGMADLMQNPPSPGNDYTDIPLWYPTQGEARRFCDDMMKKFLALRFNSEIEPKQLFGLSPFVEGDYDRGSRFWKVLVRQAEVDSSLSALLKEKSIALHGERLSTTSERDQVLRKLKPILVLRDAFRRQNGSTLRSRKKPGLYYGYDAIAAISDGNPRWLTGLLSDLLLSSEGVGQLSARRQEDVLAAAGARFNALVNSLPQLSAKVPDKTFRLRDLLRAVADYFFRRIVVDDVSLDPPNCVVVDSRTNDAILKLLEKAVDLGALIIVSEGSDSSLPRSLRGAKLRLSFMLATVYRQPLRVLSSVALSQCLQLGSQPDRMPLFQR